jgi:hypothetical protein
MADKNETVANPSNPDRYDEMIAAFSSLEPETLAIIRKLVVEAVYLEEELDRLRPMPKLLINRKTGETRKSPAADMYSQYLSRYNEVIRVLSRTSGQALANEPSILEEFLMNGGLDA